MTRNGDLARMSGELRAGELAGDFEGVGRGDGMSDLPAGWIGSSLSKLVAPGGLFSDGDWVESKDQDPNGATRLLQLADIGDGYFIDKSSRFINDEKFVELRCTELLESDVLIARMPDPLGRACLMPKLPQRCVTVVDVAVFRPGNKSVSSNWLMHTINAPQFRAEIELKSSGTTRKRISRGNLAVMALPVPPLPEQIRIADKLDTVLARVDACRDRLDRVPALLKRFRQSILAAATSGRLTEDWRSDHQASVSPEKVLVERKALAAKATDRKNLDAFLDNFPVTKGQDCDLPDSWVATHIGSTGIVSNGSTPSRKEPSFWGGEIPWVSSGEVRNTIISTTREAITQAGFQNSSVRLLPQGTVLIAMIGEGKTRGQSALLDIDACINQNVAGVIPVEKLLMSKYLWYWFQSQYEQTRTQGSGTGPQALNCQRVRELLLNLPPLTEQSEIVRRVEILLAFADRLEARLATARKQVEQLTPALLAKAFRGELVPQDPADEPASELLKRLAAQRAIAPTEKRGRGRASIARSSGDQPC